MPAQTAPWVGLTLAGGRYEVKSKLGEGGMGFVYRAFDRNLECEVVIKVPRPAMLEDPEFAARFQRELRSLVKLSHPHVVKLLDVGEYDGLPFAVMQFLAGGSLRDRQTRTPDGQPVPMPLARLGAWLPQIASALDFIHREGYVHRDIKPDNILFDAHGNVYLSDFGVAKVVNENRDQKRNTVMTGAGMVLGTPHYMAPELLLGQKLDGRVDQYALAVMAYELLAGAYPYDGEAAMAIFMQHTTAPVPTLRGVPAHVAAAVRRGMAKQPAERFADCAALARAVLDGAVAARTTAPDIPVARRTTSDVPVARPADANVPVVQRADPDTRRCVCPRCRKAFGVPAAYLGRKARCPGCKEEIELVDSGAVTATQSQVAPPVGTDRNPKPPGAPAPSATPRPVPAAPSADPFAFPKKSGKSGAHKKKSSDDPVLDTFDDLMKGLPPKQIHNALPLIGIIIGVVVVLLVLGAAIAIFIVLRNSGLTTQPAQKPSDVKPAVAENPDPAPVPAPPPPPPPVPQPGFSLRSVERDVSLVAGKLFVLPIEVQRDEGFDDEIDVQLDEMPKKVEVGKRKILFKQNLCELPITPDENIQDNKWIARLTLSNRAVPDKAAVTSIHFTVKPKAVAVVPRPIPMKPTPENPPPPEAPKPTTVKVEGTPFGKQRTHLEAVLGVAFSGSGAASIGDYRIRVWGLINRQVHVREDDWGKKRGAEWQHAAFNSNGTNFVIANGLSGLMLGRVGGVGPVKDFGRTGDKAVAGAFSGDGKWVASVHEDGAVRVYDVDIPDKPRRVVNGVTKCVALSRDGRLVACGDKEGVVRLHDVVAGGEPAVLRGHRGGVADLAFDSQDRYVVSAGEDDTVCLWDLAKKATVRTWQSPEGVPRIAFTAVCFSGDGRRVGAGTKNGQVYVYDVNSDVPRYHCTGAGSPILDVALAPNGRAALAGIKYFMYYWDLKE